MGSPQGIQVNSKKAISLRSKIQFLGCARSVTQRASAIVTFCIVLYYCNVLDMPFCGSSRPCCTVRVLCITRHDFPVLLSRYAIRSDFAAQLIVLYRYATAALSTKCSVWNDTGCTVGLAAGCLAVALHALVPTPRTVLQGLVTHIKPGTSDALTRWML